MSGQIFIHPSLVSTGPLVDPNDSVIWPERSRFVETTTTAVQLCYAALAAWDLDVRHRSLTTYSTCNFDRIGYAQHHCAVCFTDDDGQLVTDRRRIAITYMKGWLAFDLLTSIPYEQMLAAGMRLDSALVRLVQVWLLTVPGAQRCSVVLSCCHDLAFG